MRVNEHQQEDLLEDIINYYFKEKNKEVKDILSYLNKHNDRLIGKDKGREIIISLSDVYYFESVDKKTFCYLQDKVYHVDLNLQELEEIYQQLGFIRINKSTVLNIYKIKYLKAGLNMRVIACLSNKEEVQINRSYKKRFNDFLKQKSRGGNINEDYK